MIARRVRVTGRVRGVFFRAWTRDEARRLGVTGWVRNCADGSVEAHVEGDETRVQALIERLNQGPPHARVDRIDVNEAPLDQATSFEVRH
jgi:acylphosphatase